MNIVRWATSEFKPVESDTNVSRGYVPRTRSEKQEKARCILLYMFLVAGMLYMKTRDSRKKIAEDTVRIIKNQTYTNKKNETVSLYKKDTHIDYKSKLYTEEETLRIKRTTDISQKDIKPTVKVTKDSVVDAILKFGSKPKEYGKVAVLNFASARHAGGGFLKGSMSQEEAIALSSDLYYRIKDFENFYKYKKHYETPLYSHRMIYTNNLVVFRNSKGELLNYPINVDVITSPAVNVRDLKQKKMYDLLKKSEEVMEDRIERIIALAKCNNVDTLILGAFGAGVFENNPYKVKEAFIKVLNKPEYRSEFKHVIFAIYEKPQDRNKLYNIFSSIKINV